MYNYSYPPPLFFCLKFFIGNFAAPILFFTELWYNIPVGKNDMTFQELI